MSIKVMSEVWSSSRASGSKLLLLLAIADNSNEDRICWPGIKYLASKVRMSDRSVQRLIRELDTDWELAIEYGAGRGNSHLYHVLTGLTENDKIRIKSEVDKYNKESGYDLAPDLNGDKMSPPPEPLNGDKIGLNGDKNSLNGDMVTSPESLTFNPKNININKDNIEDPFFKYFKMALQQVALEFKFGESDQSYIRLMSGISFTGYDRDNNKVIISADTPEAGQQFKARAWATISRLLWNIVGLEDLPGIEINIPVLEGVE